MLSDEDLQAMATADYLALGDFAFWRLEIEEARLIAGFGEIRWLDGAALR